MDQYTVNRLDLATPGKFQCLHYFTYKESVQWNTTHLLCKPFNCGQVMFRHFTLIVYSIFRKTTVIDDTVTAADQPDDTTAAIVNTWSV